MPYKTVVWKNSNASVPVKIGMSQTSHLVQSCRDRRVDCKISQHRYNANINANKPVFRKTHPMYKLKKTGLKWLKMAHLLCACCWL